MIFDREYLLRLFAGRPEKHLRQIEDLHTREKEFFSKRSEFPRSVASVRTALQIDKDEKILTLYTFAALNKCCHSWCELIWKCFDHSDLDCADLELKLEKACPQSKRISDSLKKCASNNNIRYVRETSKHVKYIEGSTRFDAVLSEKKKDGIQLFFECKFTSDISYATEHCDSRNQIARCIDIGLDYLGDEVSRFYFILITPERYKGKKSRLYDFKMKEYMTEPRAIANDIPRISDWSEEKLLELSKRIGWLTWEDCFKIFDDCTALSAQERLDMREFYIQRRLVAGEGMDPKDY